MWNGDFDAEIEEDFSPDVAYCGCYFIGQAKDIVDQCPGVYLGAFFTLPPAPKNVSTEVSETVQSERCGFITTTRLMGRSRKGEASVARPAWRGQQSEFEKATQSRRRRQGDSRMWRGSSEVASSSASTTLLGPIRFV